jgi:hypothetical protein
MYRAHDIRSIAHKYDGTAQRGPGRPKTADEIETLVVQLAEETRPGLSSWSPYLAINCCSIQVAAKY